MDKLIENQQAEIESRNQLRYDALKGEHSRSPYYYDSWCKLHDHKGVVGTSDKPPIYYAVNLLNKLTEQNAALHEEVERLKAEVDNIKQVEFPRRVEKLRTGIRKQAAREIEKHLLGMFWTIPYKENEPMIYRDQAIEWLRDKFGLEG